MACIGMSRVSSFISTVCYGLFFTFKSPPYLSKIDSALLRRDKFLRSLLGALRTVGSPSGKSERDHSSFFLSIYLATVGIRCRQQLSTVRNCTFFEKASSERTNGGGGNEKGDGGEKDIFSIFCHCTVHYTQLLYCNTTRSKRPNCLS